MGFVSNYLKLTALVTLVFGLTLILFPGWAEATFLNNDLDGSSFTRFLGASLFGHSYLNYRSSYLKDPGYLKVVIEANLLSLSIAVIISLVAILSGILKERALFFLFMHSIFMAGFIVARRKAQASTAII